MVGERDRGMVFVGVRVKGHGLLSVHVLDLKIVTMICRARFREESLI